MMKQRQNCDRFADNSISKAMLQVRGEWQKALACT
jgi:hypothetical protein